MTALYRIRIKGHLDSNWADEFDNMAMDHLVDGSTQLLGRVDQSALHGILARIHALGLTLLEVTCEAKEGATRGTGICWRKGEGEH